MGKEDQIVDALLTELERQAADPKQKLSVKREDPPSVAINGRVDLDKLAMVVMGALAGGP
jgi:hypothetical protein